MNIKVETLKVLHGKDDLHLFCAYPEGQAESLPAMLIFPRWNGRDEPTCQIAESFAKKGFFSIAVDLYGQAKVGTDRATCQSLISPFVSDRAFLKDRLLAVLAAVKNDKRINVLKISALGYCFGGLCVLDMVRNNMGLMAGISVHGLLNAPSYSLPEKYTAKVLAFHGYKDPMVPSKQKEAFESEMHAAKVDWQLIIYGTGYHAFTTPDANDVDFGTVYDSLLDHRTTKMIDSFLEEIK